YQPEDQETKKALSTRSADRAAGGPSRIILMAAVPAAEQVMAVMAAARAAGAARATIRRTAVHANLDHIGIGFANAVVDELLDGLGNAAIDAARAFTRLAFA